LKSKIQLETRWKRFRIEWIFN